MIRSLKVFDIVSSSYPSLDGTLKEGLFLVLNVSKGNMLCAKITSQFDSRYMNYAVLVYQRTNPFLQCDSYIQLDKLLTLNSNRCAKIGSLAPVIRPDVKNVFNRMLLDILTSLNKNIRQVYRSPNKR